MLPKAKIPYIIIIGDKEEEKKTIAVRNRKGKTEYNVNVESFIKNRKKDIEERLQYEEK